MMRFAILVLLAALPLSAEDADLDALIGRLGSGDAETRDRATEEISRLGEGAEKRLRERLNDPDPEVRARIQAVLDEIPRRRLRGTVFEPLREIRATGGVVVRLAWSPDGKRLACGGERGEIAIWDVANREIVRDFQAFEPTGMARITESVFCLAWSPDGKDLWAGCTNGLACWDAATGGLKSWTDGASHVVAFSRDGKQVAWCGENIVHTADAAEPGKSVSTAAIRASRAGLRFDESGKTLLVAFSTDVVWRIDASTGEKRESSTGDPATIPWDAPAVAWLDDEGRMVFRDGELAFPRSGTKREETVTCVSVAASGLRIAAKVDSDILVFDDAGKELARHGVPGPTCETAWAPDGSSLAVAFGLHDWSEGRIAVFSGGRCVVLPGNLKGAHQLAFSPDASLLAWRTEFWDDEVLLRSEAHVVHLETGHEIVLRNARVIPGSRDAQFVALRKHSLTLFDGRDGNPEEILWHSRKGLPQGRAALDPAGRFIWVGEDQGEGALLCRFDPRKRRTVHEAFTAPRAEWSPDGKFLAISSFIGADSRIVVLDDDAKVRFDETGSAGTLAWTPDGGKLLLFDGESCRALEAGTFTEISKRDAKVGLWRFISPDAALGTYQGRASLWSVPTMTAVKSWDVGRVRELAVSSDGSRVAFGLENSIRVEHIVRK